MSYPELQIEDYIFHGFNQTSTGVGFEVVPVRVGDMNEADKKRVSSLLDDLGKWENLIEVGLNLAFELKLTDVNKEMLEHYEKRFQRESYEVDCTLAKKRLRMVLYCHIEPSEEEHHRRLAVKATPKIEIEEIYEPLNNVRKWRAFSEGIKHIKEISV